MDVEDNKKIRVTWGVVEGIKFGFGFGLGIFLWALLSFFIFALIFFNMIGGGFKFPF